MTTRNADDWTIERWRTEPRLVLDLGDTNLGDTAVDKVPPLWKDVTVASAVALLLWAAAAIVLG